MTNKLSILMGDSLETTLNGKFWSCSVVLQLEIFQNKSSYWVQCSYRSTRCFYYEKFEWLRYILSLLFISLFVLCSPFAKCYKKYIDATVIRKTETLNRSEYFDFSNNRSVSKQLYCCLKTFMIINGERNERGH